MRRTKQPLMARVPGSEANADSLTDCTALGGRTSDKGSQTTLGPVVLWKGVENSLLAALRCIRLSLHGAHLKRICWISSGKANSFWSVTKTLKDSFWTTVD